MGLLALTRQGAIALLLRVAGTGLGFLFMVLLARKLGAEGSGAYAAALTVLLFSSTLTRLGMDMAMLKFAAAAIAQGHGRRTISIERAGVGLVFLLSGMVAATGYFLSDKIALHYFGDMGIAAPLRAMWVASVPFSVLALYGELLKAGGQYAAATLAQGAGVPALAFAGLLLLESAISRPAHAALIYLASCTLVLLWAFLAWRWHSGYLAAGSEPKIRASELTQTAWPLYGASVAGVVMTWADMLLLGHWVGSAEVGIYNAAARTALLTSFVLMAVNTVAAPRFSALVAQGRTADMAKLASNAAFLSAAATLPLLGLFIGWGDRVLSLFGEEFAAGRIPLVVIALGQAVNAMTGPVGYLLVMSGHHRAEGRISMASAGLNVLLSVMLIPHWGILGAAIANATAISACNLTRLIFVRRRTGILVLPWPMASHVSISRLR